MDIISSTIDEQLLADLGREEVEREFKKTIERLERRKLARQVAEYLKDIDLNNDPDYQKGRERAWGTHGYRYTSKPGKDA